MLCLCVWEVVPRMAAGDVCVSCSPSMVGLSAAAPSFRPALPAIPCGPLPGEACPHCLQEGSLQDKASAPQLLGRGCAGLPCWGPLSPGGRHLPVGVLKPELFRRVSIPGQSLFLLCEISPRLPNPLQAHH